MTRIKTILRVDSVFIFSLTGTFPRFPEHRQSEADITGGMLVVCFPLQTYLGFHVNKFKKPFGQRYILINDIDLSLI